MRKRLVTPIFHGRVRLESGSLDVGSLVLVDRRGASSLPNRICVANLTTGVVGVLIKSGAQTIRALFEEPHLAGFRGKPEHNARKSLSSQGRQITGIGSEIVCPQWNCSPPTTVRE